MSILLTNSVHALAARVAGWRARQRAFAELNALGDRELADIGIHRSEIPYILAHGDEERPSHQWAKPASKGYDCLRAI